MEIDYKNVKVIALKADEFTTETVCKSIRISGVYFDAHSIGQFSSPPTDYEIETLNKLVGDQRYFDPYHIYVVSKEEIKKDDWRIDIFMDNPKPIKSEKDYDSLFTRKIIATTDPNLTKDVRMLCKNCKGSGGMPDDKCKTCDKSGVRIEKEIYLPTIDKNLMYFMFKDLTDKTEFVFEVFVNEKNVLEEKKYKQNFTRKELKQFIASVFRDIDPDRLWESHASDWCNNHLDNPEKLIKVENLSWL